MAFSRRGRRDVTSGRRVRNFGDARAVERAVLVWVLAVPVPILTLVWLFGGLH